MSVQGKNRLNRNRDGTGKELPSNYIGESALIRAVAGLIAFSGAVVGDRDRCGR
jgi:hypothetical protein